MCVSNTIFDNLSEACGISINFVLSFAVINTLSSHHRIPTRLHLFTVQLRQSRMDQKQCGECQLVINELEPLRCGFCETFYHISQQCCGINIRNLKEPLSAEKILFVCNSCRGVLQGRSIRCFIDDQQQQQMQPPSLASLPDQVRQLHDAVAELSKKVDNFSAKPQRNPSLSATPVWP